MTTTGRLPGTHDWDYHAASDIFVCSRCTGATADPETYEGYCDDAEADEVYAAEAEAHRTERSYSPERGTNLARGLRGDDD